MAYRRACATTLDGRVLSKDIPMSINDRVGAELVLRNCLVKSAV